MTEPASAASATTNPRADQLREAIDEWSVRSEISLHYIIDAARDFLAVLEGPTDEMVTKAIRQFAFDIIVTEFGMDDTDTDDQLDASERVDAWMEHWRTSESFVEARAALAQIGEPGE